MISERMLLGEGKRRNFSLVGNVEARTPCFTVDRRDTNPFGGKDSYMSIVWAILCATIHDSLSSF